MQELTIKDILQIIRKYLLLIIIAPIIVAILAWVYYHYQPNQYTATTSLFVVVSYEDSTGNLRYDTTTGNSLASDYRALFERSPVIEKTEEELGIEEIGKEVKLDVSSVSNTRIVEVSATSTNGRLSMDVANTASRIFKDYIQEFMKVDSVSITQEASLPEKPSGPPRLRNTALAFAVTLVLCVGIVLAIEMLNTKIKSDTQIEEGLRIPVLGKVFDYRKELGKYMDSEPSTVNQLYRYISEPMRETIKTAAMNITFSSVDHPIRSIAITSATPNEGKSSLGVMLASAFADEGKYVLLVDMDFRNPTVGKFVKRRNRQDLMDYLVGRSEFEDVITPTGMKKLYFIDNSHSATMLSRVVQSANFSQFMRKAESMFDLIIFDTPPLGMFIDAAILASKVDGAIVTIASNRVEMDNAKDVLDQLSKSNATTLGAILNFIKPEKGNSYYYAKKYGKYYGQDSKKARSIDEEDNTAYKDDVE